MRIGIIGYGIVGAVLGYYLSQSTEHEIHVYDVDQFQGTKCSGYNLSLDQSKTQ